MVHAVVSRFASVIFGSKRAASGLRGSTERIAWWLFIGAILVLRVAYCFRLRVESDEPQHLHVAWGWVSGLVPYRDVFDNHAPLFHLACAPFFALLGERADALVWMRLALLPVFAATLFAVFRIVRAVAGTRAGLWAIVLAGLEPHFFVLSCEFRADALWALAWFWALAVLVEGDFRPLRAFVTGVWLGIALATSFKTVLMLAAFAVALIVLAWIDVRARSAWRARILPRVALSFATGFLLPPFIVGVVIARLGALDAMLACTLQHNILPGGRSWDEPLLVALVVPLVVLIMFVARRAITRASADRPLPRVLFVGISVGLYGAFAATIWPVFTRQDLMPLLPLASGAVAAWLVSRAADSPLRADRSDFAGPCCAAVALVMLVALLASRPLSEDGTAEERAYVADVLSLTGPGESVMDTKGESLFRRRAMYSVLESFTRRRMALGLMSDHIAEDCQVGHVHVAAPDDPRYPPVGREFLRCNYLDVGGVRVAGRMFTRRETAGGGPIEFDVPIAARFALVSEHPGLDASVDGVSGRGPHRLAAGCHVLEVRSARGRVALLWAPAAALGFNPFRCDKHARAAARGL